MSLSIATSGAVSLAQTDGLQPSTPSADEALAAYRRVRAFSRSLVDGLHPEDCAIQSMPDASPTRWHLAHTTWFFETFVLRQVDPKYVSPNEQFEYLFNSYYNAIGEQFPRERRGVLSRPTLSEVMDYRAAVDMAMESFIGRHIAATDDSAVWKSVSATIQLGLQHEQQHQELILTDIKHVFGANPLMPRYAEYSQKCEPRDDEGSDKEGSSEFAPPLSFIPINGGIYWLGHAGGGFCYDNELPRHEALVQDCELSNRLITNGEYLLFMEDRGYQQPSLWLSEGWTKACKERWKAPLYWFEKDGAWFEFTLMGPQPLDLNRPVCHVSFYEADAFARWSQARLPTEMEWEVFAGQYKAHSQVYGSFADHRVWHPQAACQSSEASVPLQLFGDCWQWTSSPYIGYPGYQPAAGAIGEYNGKFMCNQFVLRGGSVATSRDHIRLTYRNFFPADARWQFSGIRLAR